MKINNCIDCNKIISKYAKRCKNCSSKGKLNPAYIDGRKSKKYYCIDCGSIVSTPITKRCHSCSKKGIHNSNYRHGKRINQHNICWICQRPVSISSYKGLCLICSLEVKKSNAQFKTCLDCGKVLCKLANKKDYKRCRPCSDFLKRGKKRPEHSKHMTGKNNPAYIHGLSKFPYPLEFNKKLKESIRKRDEYKCQNCHKKGRDIHHIDYNKLNCQKNNLINVCNKCNLKANTDRDYWYAYYTYLMENK